ncbi:hypothetical protein Ple7327_3468 [Pleurocapsa sp. PCC 7327]|uniref:hypothetical protein n=1 Tax=Pleurocapsa sp. PCC 7327 TaxID=118163 RepID=UPI00029FBA12|nr:hypothetical protein [Pleurocapsa sp. PCC 7327]AFY78674.1 hypothetical protein Ple7327_3468 [Pleurocapsa sp. PCC 7327]
MIENTKAMSELNLEELDSVAGGGGCHNYEEDHRHDDDYYGDDYHGDDDYKGGGCYPKPRKPYCKPRKPSWWYPGCRW